MKVYSLIVLRSFIERDTIDHTFMTSKRSKGVRGEVEFCHLFAGPIVFKQQIYC